MVIFIIAFTPFNKVLFLFFFKHNPIIQKFSVIVNFVINILPGLCALYLII